MSSYFISLYFIVFVRLVFIFERVCVYCVCILVCGMLLYFLDVVFFVLSFCFLFGAKIYSQFLFWGQGLLYLRF